ncbi:lytic murein transglycosylase B [Thiocapsa roseopersicina]|uniref:Membrane-bound lytic murein transglycosylase B n=1 Tax=Thiocapsa roseopersicina TaxID=1058 RepID=A0A1H3CXL7_THIRO|nr:lytic murein transglycosylase B [Thiocapsa roseopersicina]SDX58826.1 membrane-bound lytic murein transglycosylase B [Thiocapsa roseopersicina]
MPVARRFFFVGCAALVASHLHAEPASYAAEADVFAREMVERHGFDSAELQGVLADARFSQAIVDAMDRPYEAKPWRDYRALFVTPERIAGGVAFRHDNAELLARAETDFGVAPQIIVAIIGVETNYGANVGKHRVIDALTTLGFAYPRRADFFRRELEAFLLLSRDEQLDPLRAVGSYAGAMGKPQFISSSYRNYALDFDGDGRRDLWGSNADVIASVANYFKQHGWRPGEPVAFAAAPRSGIPAGITLVEKTPTPPDTTAGNLRAAGVEWGEPLPADIPASLIRLDAGEDEYWVGLDNFYAITRYNHSNLYAMAVHQLSEEIRTHHSTAASHGMTGDSSAADARESADKD